MANGVNALQTAILEHQHEIADALVERGYIVLPNFLPQASAELLYNYASSLPQGEWHLAGVGREQQHTVNTHVRSDEIHWLNPAHPLEALWLEHMELLRVSLNQSLFMGLFDYESHLARYQPGSRYQKHLDAFKGRSNRVLSTVCYLNPEWHDSDGGELVIYGKRGQVLEKIVPRQGTLVVFLSDAFVHEVLVSNRLRLSLTGWFRHNTSSGQRIDPAQ